MESLLERKRRYIQAILRGHPVYLPESSISQQAAKAMERLPEQTLFYLYHLLPSTS